MLLWWHFGDPVAGRLSRAPCTPPRIRALLARRPIRAQLHFFKPNPKIIKKRIEHLIDREYLERDRDDPNVFHYLA